MQKYTRRFFFRKIMPLAIFSLIFREKEVNASENSKSENSKNITTSSNLHDETEYVGRGDFPASKIITEVNVDVQSWLNNSIVTPNMFYKESDIDWSNAFIKASQIAHELSLPVTLIPTVYTFFNGVDLSMFSFGLQCVGDRNNKIILKAVGNANHSRVFVKMKNVDRRRTGGFLIDANGLYDVAFDTSWTVTGGPSLMMVWEKIQIQGWKKIGWIANNNNDVWNKNITIIGSLNADADAVSYFNHSAGGPISFEGCSFSGGRIEVTAQHISAMFCVFRGVEIKQGGSSWNVFTSVGCHFFKDHYFNACFIISGAIQGFSVIGGLVEPTDGGTVIFGNGNKASLNCGMIIFQGVRISSYNKGKPAVLTAGKMKNEHGTNEINISGGFLELSTINVNDLPWLDIITLESVLLNGKKTEIVSKKITKNFWKYKNNNVDSISVPSTNSKCCLIENHKTNLSSINNLFGKFDLLDYDKSKNSSGIIKIIYDDGGGYAEFFFQRQESTTKISPTSSFYAEKDRTISIESNSEFVFIKNGREHDGGLWSIMVCFSGMLDYLP